MRVKDLHILPKFRDGWSYLYLEHCKIEQEARAIAVWDARGKVPVPCAAWPCSCSGREPLLPTPRWPPWLITVAWCTGWGKGACAFTRTARA